MAGQTVVILGGGISGLSAAYYMQKFCSHLSAIKKIIVLESSSHLGGWLKTHTFEDGVKHELGPKTIRVPTNPGYNVLSLVEDIGLADEIIGTPAKSIATQKRLILYNNELIALPNTLIQMFQKWKPLPKRMISYVLKDLRTKKLDLTLYGDDISVYDFASQRMAPEVADYMFDPLCRGISAGSARKLSALSMFPQMVRAEQEVGSIIGGAMVNARRDKLEASHTPLIQKAKTSRWSTVTFRDGMQALPDRLCHFLLNLKGSPVEIYNESTVQKIEFSKETQKATITVKTADDTVEVEADQILSSIPAQNLAQILPQFPDLSETLNEIQTVHMAVVNLEFKGKVMPKDAGFGYLVPSVEKSNILGTVFDSCVSPQFDADRDITRLTVMMGGEWFEEVLGDVNSADQQLALDVSLDAIRSHLKITSPPLRHLVSFHKDCIPQYYLGHRLKLEKINRFINENSLNLTLLGASYQGFSVPDCILNSKKVAEKYSEAIMKFNHQTVSNSKDLNLENKSVAQ